MKAVRSVRTSLTCMMFMWAFVWARGFERVVLTFRDILIGFIVPLSA